MKARYWIYGVVVAGVVGTAGFGLYRLGLERGMEKGNAKASPDEHAHAADAADGKRVLYWHDPMVPGHRFDKPGKSPFMDMELVPVYADGAGDDGAVTISPRVQQNLGIRTVEAAGANIAVKVEAVGNVAYDERDIVVVQARSSAFVEKLHVRATLDPVRKGQPLADLYVPEWVAAQEEYLSTRRMAGTRLEPLIDGARQRMRLAGMTEDQVMLVETSGAVHARMTVVAPIDGVLSELGAREGMAVAAGAGLFRINGLRTVWVNAEVPENLAARIRAGNAVEARTPALPGETFKGRVSAILPEVDRATRTIKARVELANPQGRLVPGMFATVEFASAPTKVAVAVPTEAVIRTGKRNVVIVTTGEGRFAPVDVETGMESGGLTEIRRGVDAGQRVVVSGQFLIDSEASLKGTVTRMGAEATEGTDRHNGAHP